MKKNSYLDLIAASPTLESSRTNTPKPICVLLDNVRSLYNVGSIFRTSDAAGIEKLYLCGITGQPPRAEIHKAALGAELSVRFEYVQNPVEIIRKLKSERYQIVVLEHTDASLSYDQAKFQFPICLVVGHEISGVSDEVVALADLAIQIPMHGIKQSLNVSVAYGIAIFEIIKQCQHF